MGERRASGDNMTLKEAIEFAEKAKAELDIIGLHADTIVMNPKDYKSLVAEVRDIMPPPYDTLCGLEVRLRSEMARNCCLVVDSVASGIDRMVEIIK